MVSSARTRSCISPSSEWSSCECVLMGSTLANERCSIHPASRSFERSVLEPGEIEPIDFPQQVDETPGALGERRLALLGRRAARIADGAGGVQVLRHPAE